MTRIVFNTKSFRSFARKNYVIERELYEKVGTQLKVSPKVRRSRKLQRREHARRFSEVYKLAKTIEWLEEVPFFLFVAMAVIAGLSLFVFGLVGKFLCWIGVFLALAAQINIIIIRRDYQSQLLEELKGALRFSEKFNVSSRHDFIIYDYAKSKLL